MKTAATNVLADRSTPKVQPSQTVAADLKRAAAALPGVHLIRGDAVKLEPVRWLWPGFLPAGMLTILGGAPGSGKTTIALSLAATLTRASAWPDGSTCGQAGDVIVWSGEDAAPVLAARLRAGGAEMGRVHFVDGLTGPEGDPFDPGRDMPLLELTAQALPAVRLLILDPIVSAVTGDSHKGAEVRRSLAPVVTLAQRLGCAVLGITHFSKGTSGRDPVERVTGSIAFAALARLVLVAAKVKAEAEPGEEGDPRRVLMRAKSNIGPDDGGFAYTLERVEVEPGVEGQRVRWGEALDGSARDILADAESDDRDDEADGVDGFLRGLLADGPASAKMVKADAGDAGYAWRTVQRAAQRLGVERHKGGMKGGWVWALRSPKAPRPPEGATRRGDGFLAPSGGAFEGDTEHANAYGVAPSASSASSVAPSGQDEEVI